MTQESVIHSSVSSVTWKSTLMHVWSNKSFWANPEICLLKDKLVVPLNYVLYSKVLRDNHWNYRIEMTAFVLHEQKLAIQKYLGIIWQCSPKTEPILLPGVDFNVVWGKESLPHFWPPVFLSVMKTVAYADPGHISILYCSISPGEFCHLSTSQPVKMFSCGCVFGLFEKSR